MAKPKVVTKRMGLRLDVDAIELLAQLAPSINKRGKFVSDLIRAAAHNGTYPRIRARIAALEEELARLKAEVG